MDPDSRTALRLRRGAATARPPRRSPPETSAGEGGRILITLTDGRGRPASAPGLAAWLRRVAPRNAPPEITIALVSDARIRALNRIFRRKDAVTDVLSFEPADIAIGVGVAGRQAREAGHSYAQELKVLALHGLLHLIGYDHHDPADGGRMSRLERRLRAKGGLHAGLIERAERASAASEPRQRPASARSASARSRRSRGAGGSAPATLRQAQGPERRRSTKRRAREPVGVFEGRSPSKKK